MLMLITFTLSALVIGWGMRDVFDRSSARTDRHDIVRMLAQTKNRYEDSPAESGVESDPSSISVWGAPWRRPGEHEPVKLVFDAMGRLVDVHVPTRYDYARREAGPRAADGDRRYKFDDGTGNWMSGPAFEVSEIIGVAGNVDARGRRLLLGTLPLLDVGDVACAANGAKIVRIH